MCSLCLARSFLRQPHAGTAKSSSGDQVGIVMQAFLDWLVAEFYVYGVPVQNWMLIAGAMFAIFFIFSWQDHHKSR
jgi:hypothetical protein